MVVVSSCVWLVSINHHLLLSFSFLPPSSFSFSLSPFHRDVRLTGVLGLGDLRDIGKMKGWCPYFLARHLLEFVNVVVYSYQYVLHPRIRFVFQKKKKKMFEIMTNINFFLSSF